MNPLVRAAGLALLAGLAVLPVLAGCSTPPAPEHHVATLETTGSTPTTTAVSSATPPASRPRERLDMTSEEIDELFQAYNQCLGEHGFRKNKPIGGDGDSAAPAQGEAPSAGDEAAAEAACLGSKPLPPWEYDTANPESADFVHRVVLCLRAKGVRYVEESPATPGDDRRGIEFGGPNNDSESISKGLNLVGSCEKESAHK
ncbi:hypothetical protein [Actinophytocola sp.]|uniref:hypothetical protein n=1 Tax=Actinophytocola sp. TaxID=1872138 RepID=UPI00389A9724